MSKEPTEAQKKAGNYAKEHLFMHGMRFSIENPAGSVRRGVDEDGTPWESEMAHDYGYIRYSKGKDKDHIDAFLGPDADDPDRPAYVIDQKKGDQFDEHKVMLGFRSADEAREAYLKNYPPGWDGIQAVTEMSVPDLKKWAYQGAEGGKRKPVSELKAFQLEAESVADKNTGNTGPTLDLPDLVSAARAGVFQPLPAPISRPIPRRRLSGALEQVQGYAAGGLIDGPQTVGLGQFGAGGQSSGTMGASPMGGGIGGIGGIGSSGVPVATPSAQLPQVPTMNPDQTWNPVNGSMTSWDPFQRARPDAMSYGDLYNIKLNGALPGVDPNSKAPEYDLNTPMGLNNPMLQATLHSAGAGNMLTGIKAFLGDDWNPAIVENKYDHPEWERNVDMMGMQKGTPEVTGYKMDPLINLAKGVGFDYTQYGNNGQALNDALDAHLKDYAGIRGLSNGWDMTGKGARSASQTLYKNVDGVLKPVSQPRSYIQPEKGNFFQENPMLTQALMAGASILTGGLAAGATAGASGAAAGSAGSTAGAGGWGGALANAAGYGSQWAALPAWGQTAIQGAAQGALTSGITGGNPLTGAVTGAAGGVGGGLGGAAASSYLGPAYAGVGRTVGSLGAKYFANQNRS